MPLSEKRIIEAKKSGEVLRQKGYKFDLAYTSELKRAQDTLKYILDELDQSHIIEIKKSWKLNERHYGALQGLNKDDTRLKYGDEQVKLWRRSVDVRPPALDLNDSRYPGNDPKYINFKKEELPLTEDLNDTIKRVVEYFNDEIKKELLNGKNIIIVAHGNSLRALIKYLDNLNDTQIVNVEIKTGDPIAYELDDKLKPLRHYYLF